MIHIPKSKKRPWMAEREQEKKPWNRDLEHQKIYWSKEWRRLREDILTENPFCKCKRPATVVDHIIPVREGGEVWDLSNLQAMCRYCHNRKTAHESNK